MQIPFADSKVLTLIRHMVLQLCPIIECKDFFQKPQAKSILGPIIFSNHFVIWSAIRNYLSAIYQLAGHRGEPNHCICAWFLQQTRSMVDRAALFIRYLSSAIKMEAQWLLKRPMWARPWVQRRNRSIYHNLQQELRLEAGYRQAPMRNLEDPRILTMMTLRPLSNEFLCKDGKHAYEICYKLQLFKTHINWNLYDYHNLCN